MKLRYENKTDIPENMTASYVEFKEGDKTNFLHVDLADQLKANYRLQGDFTENKRKMSEQSEKLNLLIAADEQRKTDDERRILADKSANGQHDEIIADLRSKLETSEKDWSGKYSTLQKDIRDKEKRAIVAEIAQSGSSKTKRELSRLIALDLAFNENGDIIILDDNGKATSATLEDYKKALPENYPSLVTEVQPSGGMGNGSTGGVGGDKKPEDYTEADRVALHKSDPARFKQLFKTQ
jgi:hypothetical protein